MARVNEERSLRVQRGISDDERKLEIERFRQGVTRAVQSESRRKFPPQGYSLEQALELYRMAGIVISKEGWGPRVPFPAEGRAFDEGQENLTNLVAFASNGAS